MKKITLFLFLCICFQSCQQSFMYEKDISLPENVWNYDNKIEFDFEIPSTEELYNLYLDIEHGTDFKSQNMYVKFYTKSPSGKIVADVVSLEMAEKSGVWLGKCSSEACNLSIPIRSNIFFEENGDYKLTLEQFTRDADLKFVNSIGLKIEKIGAKRK